MQDESQAAAPGADITPPGSDTAAAAEAATSADTTSGSTSGAASAE